MNKTVFGLVLAIGGGLQLLFAHSLVDAAITTAERTAMAVLGPIMATVATTLMVVGVAFVAGSLATRWRK